MSPMYSHNSLARNIYPSYVKYEHLARTKMGIVAYNDAIEQYTACIFHAVCCQFPPALTWIDLIWQPQIICNSSLFLLWMYKEFQWEVVIVFLPRTIMPLCSTEDPHGILAEEFRRFLKRISRAFVDVSKGDGLLYIFSKFIYARSCFVITCIRKYMHTGITLEEQSCHPTSSQGAPPPSLFSNTIFAITPQAFFYFAGAWVLPER